MKDLDKWTAQNTDGLPTDPEALQKLLLAERDLTSHLRSMLKRKQTKESKWQSLVTAVCRVVEENLLTDPPEREVWTPPDPPKPGHPKTELAAILHLSDWQVGKVTDTYNTQQAYKNVKTITEKALEVIEAMRHAHEVRRLYIFFGGDMVEGETIFPGQSYEIDSPVYEQATNHAPRLMANVVESLSKEMVYTKVVGLSGNHGRTSKHTPKSNWDDVALRCAQLMAGNIRQVEWRHEHAWFAMERVFTWGMMLIHGHQIRGWAGVPHYGIQRKLLGWVSSLNQPWDYLWLGHFHQGASVAVNHHGFLLNGTIETGNEYALENLAATGDPMQRLAFISERHGLVYDCPLYVNERRSSSRKWNEWRSVEQ